jgi:murein L,D-transpeptidase YcbB/YkuD
MRVHGVPIHSFALLMKFYRGRAYSPVWLDDTGVLPNARTILGLLENAASEGLRPEDYHVAAIKGLMQNPALRQSDHDPAFAFQAAKLELLLTDAFFTFNTHIAVGRTPLKIRDGGIYDPRQAIHLENLLIQALSHHGQALEFTQAWVRTDPLYLGLKSALQKYRDLAAWHDWPAIPAGPELQLGDQDPVRIPLLQKKLSALGDYMATVPDQPIWDARLQAALMQFQSRSQLTPTGRLTPSTLRALNQPLENIIRQLEINLERWRWLPRNLGPRYILVNIPSYRLEVNADGLNVLSMKVVVGKEFHRTPIFASKIAAIVINPSWIIPMQIILKEKLYSIRHNPNFFEQNHITVITGWGDNAQAVDPATVDWRIMKQRDYASHYHFRQEPGPWNALGRIKIILPNPYGIYLHGTPQQTLFGESIRNFSHGCIRLEKPLALAEYVLGDRYNWSQEELSEAIHEQFEQTVDLIQPVFIYVTYMTSAPESNGLLHFYPDIYGQDQALISAWELPVLNPCASE